MWLRTTMNYQYANGGSLGNAISTLYKEGGIGRFYRGVGFAIIQNPLSRFGDTAANTGILCALQEFSPNMPVAQMTAFASLGGASWRISSGRTSRGRLDQGGGGSSPSRSCLILV